MLKAKITARIDQFRYTMVQFVDEVLIKVTAGSGGNGCCSFRREKYIQFGGPDGGDGGKGGSVYLIADRGCSSLLHLKYRMHQKAENGKHGSGRNKIGAKGQDLFLKVPVGTQVIHPATKEVLVDLTADQQKCKVAKGGDPGLGNVHFKSSKNRAPRKFTKGFPGEYIELKLSLKVLADVGLVGCPNAGKSSLIAAISAATPKIADYPFTTLRPHLGVVEVDTSFAFVMADVPGLIAGAASGQGLGVYFLKHLSRCKVLVHLISLEHESAKIMEDLKSIEHELEKFDKEVSAKTKLIVFSKSDLMLEEEALELAKSVLVACGYSSEKVRIISSKSQVGLKELIKEIASNLSSC